MSKEIETTNEAGEVVKETVFTADEFAAKDTEITTMKSELEELKKTNVERSQNFTAYSKMTEEEKKVYDANTINLLKREENLVNQVSELSGKLTEKENKEKDSAKKNALSSIHHGNEETKKAIEEKYAILNMPETTVEEINAKAGAAAKLAGIQIDPRNPLYAAFSGEAPVYKDGKEFTDTPKGKEAVDIVKNSMGIK